MSSNEAGLEQEMIIYQHPDAAIALTRWLEKEFLAESSSSLTTTTANTNNKAYTVALSGGSLPSLLANALNRFNQAHPNTLDLTTWHWFFADERLVPLDHPDSNYALAKAHLFDPFGIQTDHTYPIEDSGLSGGQSTDQATADRIAEAYADRMRHVFETHALPVHPISGIPVFDLIFLGMGPDGHTCSLFPGHALLSLAKDPMRFEERRCILSLVDSPKPPPCRITFSLGLLAAAACSVFVIGGVGKALVLAEIFKQRLGQNGVTVYPAGMVKSKRVEWVLDSAAASELTRVPS